MTYYIVGIHHPHVHDSAIVDLRSDEYEVPSVITARVGELKHLGYWKNGAKFNFTPEGELRNKIANGAVPQWRPVNSNVESKTQQVETEQTPMIEYSVEKLYHFSCSNCSQWWTIGDYTRSRDMTCPHCGTYHNVIRPKAEPQLAKASNDKLVALLRDHIPKGDGYNSEYATMLEEAASRLERL